MRLLARALVHNWSLKLTSVVLAVLLWLYVLVTTNPWTLREVEVPVQAQRVPEGLQVMSLTPSTVRVTLAGRRRRVERVPPEALQALASLSGRAAGEHEVAVVAPVGRLPRGVRVQGVGQHTVVVALDRSAEQRRPVQVSIRGRPAPGFQPVGQRCLPNEVRVAGPQTLLQAVARVVAVVDVSGIDATRTFRTRVEARDARDMPMEGLKIQPASAEVRIKVARVNTKTVPVVLGDLVLPRGVSVGAVDLSPQTVALTGDPAVLARVRFVRTASVRFGVGETVARVALRLPRGVTAVGEDSVRVAVEFASIGRGHRASAPPSPPPSPEAPTPEPSEPAAEPQPSVPADAGATPASPDGEKPGPAAP